MNTIAIEPDTNSLLLNNLPCFVAPRVLVKQEVNGVQVGQPSADFVIIYETSQGDRIVFLGDVMGKGVEKVLDDSCPEETIFHQGGVAYTSWGNKIAEDWKKAILNVCSEFVTDQVDITLLLKRLFDSYVPPSATESERGLDYVAMHISPSNDIEIVKTGTPQVLLTSSNGELIAMNDVRQRGYYVDLDTPDLVSKRYTRDTVLSVLMFTDGYKLPEGLRSLHVEELSMYRSTGNDEADDASFVSVTLL
jgi:hypothetical protein